MVDLRAGASCFSAASHHCFCSPVGTSAGAATPAVRCNWSEWLASCCTYMVYYHRLLRSYDLSLCHSSTAISWGLL